MGDEVPRQPAEIKLIESDCSESDKVDNEDIEEIDEDNILKIKKFE